jgi:tetratricopeptide (TPR) repeat protein
MASSSEIEKLERRCAENPHGLTFAPLAEAYRKHGDLDRALAVLRTGRELHPDYIPASIVLGRCHLDRAELPEAERAFAHVLTLDPENVIALKALADLAEREGRGVQAERWLNLLLAVDPSNEDAQGQLERIRSGGPVGESAETIRVEPAAEAEPELEHGPAREPELVEADTHGAPGVAAAEAQDVPPADAEHAVMSASAPYEPPEQPEPPAPEGRGDFGIRVELEEEIVLTPAPESDYRAEVPGALPDVGSLDVGALDAADELPDPFGDAPDSFDEPAHARDVFHVAPRPLDEPDQPFDPADEAFDPADAAASHLEPVPDLVGEFGASDFDADPTEPSEPETLYPDIPDDLPVVTESMAELYLRQGHRADALAIYRQLARERPDDPRLASIVAGLASEVDTAPAARPAYAAVETGGRSVAELLRGILAERLAAAPPALERFPEPEAVPEFRSRDEVLSDAEDQGEPTRPADDHLTLGAVFGEEDGGALPAVASPGSPAAQEDGGLSFDEFFGPPPAVEADATRTSPPAPSGDPDDLDQFHAWLQSLKR